MRNPAHRPNLVYDYKGYKPHPNGWLVTREVMERLDSEGRLFFPKKGVSGRIRRKLYLDESPGVPVTDVWSDIKPIFATGTERTGWGTQKPLSLLRRIIEGSSNPNDIVLDAFCGCGTALIAAEGLDRRWVGIDITWRAIAVMKDRLREAFDIEVQVEGSPTDVDGARQLSLQKPNGREQFEAWALTLVGAVPHGGPQRQGADQGADGVITFSGAGGGLESAIVSVKSGHVEAGDVQKLKGAMERHGGSIGLFVTLEEPSAPMQIEATTAGLYHSDVSGQDYPRVQIITIRALIEQGRKPDLPPLLTTPYRETLWSEEEVPRVARIRARPSKPVPARLRLRPHVPIPESELVAGVREAYSSRTDEQETELEASPALPRAARTSKPGR